MIYILLKKTEFFLRRVVSDKWLWRKEYNWRTPRLEKGIGNNADPIFFSFLRYYLCVSVIFSWGSLLGYYLAKMMSTYSLWTSLIKESNVRLFCVFSSWKRGIYSAREKTTTTTQHETDNVQQLHVLVHSLESARTLHATGRTTSSPSVLALLFGVLPWPFPVLFLLWYRTRLFAGSVEKNFPAFVFFFLCWSESLFFLHWRIGV